MSEPEGFCIRMLSPGEEAWIDSVRVVIMKISDKKVQLGIQAPKELKIEIVKRKREPDECPS